MSWTIKFSTQAEKYFRRMPKKTRLKTKESLAKLQSLQSPLFLKDFLPLSGELREFYRLRIGTYRIVFRLWEEERIIAIVNLYPRGDAYKK